MYTPVGCELESALTDIVLGELHGVALVLDEVLDLPAAIDQSGQDARQHALLESALGNVRDVVLRLPVVHLLAVHSGEADVVLL